MADVLALERFEVRAIPASDDGYAVIVERLPLLEGAARQQLMVPAPDLVGWFRVHACSNCALAVHRREPLNPAHCGVSRTAIEELGFDTSLL